MGHCSLVVNVISTCTIMLRCDSCFLNLDSNYCKIIVIILDGSAGLLIQLFLKQALETSWTGRPIKQRHHNNTRRRGGGWEGKIDIKIVRTCHLIDYSATTE